MSKQPIHIRIDNNTYNILRNNQINISSTVNELLKSFVQFDKLPKKKEESIKKELEELKEEKEIISEKMNKLTSFLVHLRTTKKETQIKELDNMLKLADSFRDSNVLTGGR